MNLRKGCSVRGLYSSLDKFRVVLVRSRSGDEGVELA